MNENRLKIRVQRNILIGSALILVAKFTAYFITNSAGVLTDAVESIVNVVAGAISLLCLYLSRKPKDKDHPFGHGKIELLSASIEGILIIVAGCLIISEGIGRLLNPEAIQRLDIGIYIIAASGALNFLMGWYSIEIGTKNNSMALIAEGKHLQSDSYSTVGLLIGLGLLFFTNIQWIDSSIAIVFGVIIIVTGFSILRKTTDNLLGLKYSNSLVLNAHLDPCNIFEQPKCHKCQCIECAHRLEPFKLCTPITVNSFINNEVEKE